MAAGKPWACTESPLDFLTYDDGGIIKAIRSNVSRRQRRRFTQHLIVCARCATREECLQIAIEYDETIGIWGGTLPHERTRG